MNLQHQCDTIEKDEMPLLDIRQFNAAIIGAASLGARPVGMHFFERRRDCPCGLSR